MKYPQVSAMPWAVQGWLDEQLEARGIDPVFYTRYVLSLLRRDVLPDKGPSKRLRREDCESVRRAAAVECLMSASNQHVGMETLVDELCAKLQDISSLAGSPPLHCDWPALAAAPRPMGAVLEQAPPTGWGVADDDARSGWPRRLYQRQGDADGNGEADPSLARLMAKFDQSIEALWSPGLEPDLPADEPACDFPSTSPPGSKSHVFIPSGTNITSSIWSDCGDDDAGLARNAELDGAWPESEGPGPTGWLGDLEGLGARTGELDCSVVWAEPEGPGLGAWSGDREDAGAGTWSADLEGLGSRAGELDCSGAWAEPEDPGTWAPSWAAALLNHNKQESSFTEVVPKSHEDVLPMEAVRLPEARPTQAAEALEGETELEEDLLTSARTHFKPIVSEAAEAAAGGAAGYADGTTFVIAAGLEVLAFRRCQSGTLLLESDASPAKYREYKEKEPYAGRYCRDADVGDEVSEFVPKFRVSVNEKCCQTEPPLPSLPADSDLFFPGDAGAWEEEAGAAQAEERRPPRRDAWDDLDCGCRAPEGLAPWEQAGGWAQAGLAAIWQAPCGLCSDAGRGLSVGGGGGGAARRLREELSRDGDQLLSDLSYVFLGSDWLHDATADPGTAAWDADEQDDDYGGAPSAGKLQCLSPADVADSGRAALRQHARSVDAFLSSCLLTALPSTLLLSASANAGAGQRAPWPGHSERKRRHSVCQRLVPEPPGYVRRPPCALVAHSLRPVTL